MANKGIDSERKCVTGLYNEGFVAVRTAGSGAGSKQPKPDILAGKNGKQFAIELKTSSNNEIYIKRTQLCGLVEFAKRFGAIPMVCVKFKRLPYVFLRINDVKRSGAVTHRVNRNEAIKHIDKNKYRLKDYS